MTKLIATVFFFSFAANAQHTHNMGHNNQVTNPLKAIEADKRKPLPLLEFMAEHQKKNMREHLEAIRDIVGGYANKDFKKIKDAGLRLGSSPQMNMMCDHMGKGAPGFTPMALQMHKNADKIVEAADKKDFNAVVLATERTLQSCTACHANYKQQIVSEEEWNKMVSKK
ncbi:MAG: hypothetical protein AB7I27_08435 [Bacteriovoracaceae bacterium]